MTLLQFLIFTIVDLSVGERMILYNRHKKYLVSFSTLIFLVQCALVYFFPNSNIVEDYIGFGMIFPFVVALFNVAISDFEDQYWPHV